MPMPIDTCLKNYSQFALRENKPSLSSFVSLSSQLLHSRHVLHFRPSTKLPRNARGNIIRRKSGTFQNNPWGITMGRGPIWGINSLSFILSFSYLFHGSSKITLTPVKINPHIYLKKFLLMFVINLVPRSHAVLHFPLAVGDLGTRLVCDQYLFIFMWTETISLPLQTTILQ